MTKPKTPEEKEHIENLISIRDDLWSGEKTREEIEEELRESIVVPDSTELDNQWANESE